MKKAIVTLLIGEKFGRRWEARSSRSWRMYCQKYGYDLICLSEALDDSDRAKKRSPAWQKCLVLGFSRVKDYDRVVWLDSDIIINDRAPDVLEGVAPERIGAADNFPFGATCDGSALSYYENTGLAPFPKIVNTGVLVATPKIHSNVFEHIYSSYENSPHSHYEMIPFSYEVLRQDLIQWIDPKFNYQVYDILNQFYPFLLASNANMKFSVKLKRKVLRTLFSRLCLDQAVNQTYFMHFAGYGVYLDEKNYWGILGENGDLRSKPL